MNIRNMYLQALVEANTTEKKRHEKEAREAVKIERELAKEQLEDEEKAPGGEEIQEVPEDDLTTEERVAQEENPSEEVPPEDMEEPGEEDDSADPAGTDDQEENPAPEDIAGTDQDPLGDAGTDFDMDVSDEDLATDEVPAEGEGEEGQDPMAQVPAPDGLPEADDDGSGDEDPTPEEQNVQVNILQLSRLDRQLAMKYIYRNLMGLRSSINSLLETIDRNEVIIVPEVREPAITELNRITVNLDRFMKYRFPTINYEKALQCYFIFAKQINAVADRIRNEGFGAGARQHKNKGD